MLAAVFERRLAASVPAARRMALGARYYSAEFESGPSTHAETSTAPSTSSESPDTPSSSTPSSSSSTSGPPSDSSSLLSNWDDNNDKASVEAAFDKLFDASDAVKPTPRKSYFDGLNDFDDDQPARPSSYKREPTPQVVNLLWDRVIKTPSAIMHASPMTAKKLEPLLARSTPSPQRNLRGTRVNVHRSKGQTPSEAAMMSESLLNIFSHLQDRTLHGAKPSRIEEMLLGQARPATANRRAADDKPDTLRAVDALKEELSMLLTTPEVLAFAKEKLFSHGAGGAAVDFGIPKTYPYMVAEVMRHLRIQLNNPHLALAVFEHARTLSPQSYLQGCQTKAYNEILATRWDSFRDLRGVADAIREMEAMIIHWDRDTQRIVDHVISTVGNDLQQGSAAQRWGSDVNVILSGLEHHFEKDTQKQDVFHDRRVAVKRFERQEARQQFHAAETGRSGPRGPGNGYGGNGGRDYGHDGERRNAGNYSNFNF